MMIDVFTRARAPSPPPLSPPAPPNSPVATPPTTNTVGPATVSAGCDVQSAGWPAGQPWSTGGQYIDYIPGAVKAGLLPEASLDDALRHAVGLRFRLGLFDPIEDQPYVPAGHPSERCFMVMGLHY